MIEGPGTIDSLHTKNKDLKEHVKELNAEVKDLNADIKYLTKQILNAHIAESERVPFLKPSLS